MPATNTYMTYYKFDLENTGEAALSQEFDNSVTQNSINNNRQFIKLQQAFDHQLKLMANVFENEKDYTLSEKMSYSTEAILNCFPDRISLQLTEDSSIFYTILKDHRTIYFEYFLIEEHDDSDEAIVNVFEGEENLINFAGSLSDCIVELNKVFNLPSRIPFFV